MAHFIRNGNTFRVMREDAIDIQKTLPLGTYVIDADPFGNMFLRRIDDFDIKFKLYGSTERHADRILRTFLARPNNTGVLLSGEKGSGKTLLARRTAIKAAADFGIPTVVINQPFHGEQFNSLVQAIEQPCILLFDEFEKVYHDDSWQEQILTLLDGVYQTNKLFLFTVNDPWKINQMMRNRPGRIFYFIEYKGLEPQFIREYCNDVLADKKWIEQICNISTAFDAFNFDMLKALVEDMNRYDESPQQVMEVLNARPAFSQTEQYEVKLEVEGVKIPTTQWYNLYDGEFFRGNPFSGVRCHVWHEKFKDPKDEDDDGDKQINFRPDDLKRVEAQSGSYHFFSDRFNAKLTLTKRKYGKGIDYTMFEGTAGDF